MFYLKYEAYTKPCLLVLWNISGNELIDLSISVEKLEKEYKNSKHRYFLVMFRNEADRFMDVRDIKILLMFPTTRYSLQVK